MPPKKKAKHAGPPTKAPGGLGRVLFVRATPDLLAALDREARARGPGVSRSDVARDLLARALASPPA